MKKYNIEATDENILKSIENDVLQRSSDVSDFLSLLDTIDDNVFISVDAAWGEGKTFFIRQVEMTMKYYYKKWFNKPINEKETQAFQKNNILNDLDLEHTYLPVYFNAWLYDNHTNALMALLMVAIKQSDKYVDTTLSTDNIDKLSTVLDSIQFWKNSNWSNLFEKFKGKNILDETLLLEEVRKKVYEIFDNIITEEAQKLVIFVDELDRCRPTFAVEILESIKHYFDDDRIIFVMSVNKSQLIHTVSKCYGDEFDSNLYLNKFFDINIQLPQADARVYFDLLGISCDEFEWIKKFANELQKYYSLSLRDTTMYFQKITAIYEKYQGRIGTDSWKVLMLIIPVVCVLDIVDITKKQKILSGNGFEILQELISNSEDMRRYVIRFSDKTVDNEENYNAGMEELKKVYAFGFSGSRYLGYYQGHLDIRANLGKECMRICNTI